MNLLNPSYKNVSSSQCRVVSAGLALTCHDIDADGLARLRSSLTSGPRAGRVTSLQLRDLPASVSHLSSWMLRNLTLASLEEPRGELWGLLVAIGSPRMGSLGF